MSSLKKSVVLASLVALSVSLLTGCNSIDTCFGKTDTTGCVDSPKEITAIKMGVARQVKKTEAYLVAHPRGTRLDYWIEADWSSENNYIFYTTDSKWNAWYVVGQFGGGETDGAFYYDSPNHRYGVCGKRYLKYDWGKSAFRSRLCPAVLRSQVNTEVIAR